MLALPEHLFPHMLGADPAAWEERRVFLTPLSRTEDQQISVWKR